MAGWTETVYGATDDHPIPRDEPLPEIPEMFKADPAVLEANRIIQGRSSSRGIPSWFRKLTDGRVVR